MKPITQETVRETVSAAVCVLVWIAAGTLCFPESGAPEWIRTGLLYCILLHMIETRARKENP